MGGSLAAIPDELVNLETLQKLAQQLKHAFEQRDHEQIIHHTTTAIDEILESQLLNFLDIRAYTHASQGRFQSALKDAQRMIGHAPKEAAGYLRKADIFSMYGRQICAIEAYDEGINNVASDHEEMSRLIDGQAKAVATNNKTVDLFARFPAEITSNITSRLPQATITQCLITSNTWRQQVLKSKADLWRNFSVDKENDSNLISAAPLVGRFVEHLVINTPNKNLRDACFRAIKNGHLSEIRSLKVTAVACDNLRDSIVTMSNALWQARNTLKELDIDLDEHKHPITLADLLLSCNTVTDINFSSKSSVAPLSGDYSTLEKHHSLTNLQLTSSTIKRIHIKGVLQRCQQLRRLVMCGCDSTVLKPINKYASNLEILGYNCTSLVPALTSEEPHPGLKVLYTNDGGEKVPFGSMFPVIYKNMRTLEDLQVILSSPTEPLLQQLFWYYPDFKLEKLKRLVVWPHVRVQPLIMRAIRGVFTLEYLHVVEPFETDHLFKSVMRLPVLTTLGITHAQAKAGRSSLIQLLRRYAHVSATEKSLQSVRFQYCDGIDDSVLAALAEIKTLEDATLCSLNDVTTAGINSFLEKTHDHLKNLTLTDLASVSDASLILLADSKSLVSIELEDLPNVSHEAIEELIDNTKHALTVTVDGHVATYLTKG